MFSAFVSTGFELARAFGDGFNETGRTFQSTDVLSELANLHASATDLFAFLFGGVLRARVRTIALRAAYIFRFSLLCSHSYFGCGMSLWMTYLLFSMVK